MRDVVVLATVVFGAAFGGNLLGIRGLLIPAPARPTPLAHVQPGGEKVLASQWWWQSVATLQGTGSATAPISIVRGAAQWRLRWHCTTGTLEIQVPGSQPSGRKRMVDSRCPAGGTAYSTALGQFSVEITASSAWQLVIEQQVDAPRADPPLAAMTAQGAVAVASASFYGVDQKGSGKATVYRLADSSFALRLEHFYVTPNTDLEIRFSEVAAPHTDADASRGVVSVAPLEATAGSMNFVVPRSADPRHYRSIVIWCLTLQTAYAAATLGPPS